MGDPLVPPRGVEGPYVSIDVPESVLEESIRIELRKAYDRIDALTKENAKLQGQLGHESDAVDTLNKIRDLV
jgi:hypothetical protein